MALLAVDLGVRCGLACFGRDGRLQWYRSRNYGSAGRLRRAAYHVIHEPVELVHVVAEGDRNLGAAFEKHALRRGATFRLISAEDWRAELLLKRQRRSGSDAKQHADQLARQVIDAGDAPAPTSLRHDAAEAILVGLWAVRQLGWPEPLEGS